MPFQPGNSYGENNKDTKQFKRAITRALKARANGDDAQALEKIATKLVDKAEKGDLAAISILADRLDGKAQNNDDRTPQSPFMMVTAEDVARLVYSIARSRGFAVPSSINRITAQEVGTLQTISQAEAIP